MSSQHKLALVEELRGERCEGCGGTKHAGRSFCYACYKKPPKHLRVLLYQRLGDGYEEAHADAMNLLRGGN